MRALGPGSVSSLLKIILDVVYAALWVGVIGLVIVMILALLLSFNPEFLQNVKLAGDHGDIRNPVALISGGLFAASLYLAGVLIIVGSLRRIFMTLTSGDPFHPQNISRLRLIGLMLAGLEVARWVVFAATRWLLPEVDGEANLSLTAWFSVLVVFVLAEIFREGARLRREAELTI
jgi:uncharacterized membrane protein (DUF485 family)